MIDLGPDPLTGKRRQHAKVGFDSERVASDALAEANAGLRSNSFVPSSRRTVNEFLIEWPTTIEMTVKPTTFANYKTYAEAYVIPIIGDRKLQDIEPATINALYRHLLTSGRRRGSTNQAMYSWWRTETQAGRPVRPVDIAIKAGVSYSAATNAIRRYRAGRTPASTSAGLSARAVASIHVMVHRAFRDAVNWRYVPANPAATAESPRPKKRQHTTWTAAQLGIFLDQARGDRFYAMWLLFATTGLSQSEAVCALREALDLDAGTISLVNTRVITGGKAHTGARRVGIGLPNHELLFCWPDGSPIYHDTITERFGRLVERAGLPIIRLHDVRHTYATMALRADVNPEIISTRLGHATVAFTLDTYTADVPELDRAAAEQISELFLPSPNLTSQRPTLDEA
jgi:integrase